MKMKMNQKTYDELRSMLKSTYGAEPSVKQDSVFMWILYAISLMWIWNRRFMSDYTTTIFGRVYFPKGYVEEHPGEAAHTLAHEGQHVDDEHRVGKFAFNASYLFPQVLSLLAVLAIFSPWFLLALAFLLPLPAPWREHWERRGYTITVVGGLLQGEDVDDPGYVAWLAGQFSTFNYYRMSWSKARGEKVAREIIAEARRIVSEGATEAYAHIVYLVMRSTLA